jgi:hypothetical protein
MDLTINENYGLWVTHTYGSMRVVPRQPQKPRVSNAVVNGKYSGRETSHVGVIGAMLN